MKHLFTSTRPLHTDLGLLLLRIMSGGAMAYSHGWGKFSRVLDGEYGFADVFGMGEKISLFLAVFAELFCAILVVLGLFTRAALVPLTITMLVAVFYIHADDPFSKQEFGLLYLIPYIALFLMGPGKYSIDHKLQKS